MVGPFPLAVERPVGPTYAAVLSRQPRAVLLAALAGERFTGWVGPDEDGWCVAVPQAPAGHVARRRRHVDDLARLLAAGSPVPVASVKVEADAVLHLWAGTRDGELLDYTSDVSSQGGEWSVDPFGNPVPPPEGPSGAERAGVLARALGHPDATDELTDLLLEDLGESTSEAERLERVARLLGWPGWLVSVGSLPRGVPGGPELRAFTRLRAGRGGVPGVLVERLTRVVRRRS